MTAAPEAARSARVPGELVLHPLALTSLALLLLNDHVLKGVGPGWLTGKLSDVAGLLFLPFLALALVDVARRGRAPGPRSAVAVAVLTGAAFAAIKLWDVARSAYAEAAAVLRYPFDALAALAHGDAPGAIDPVVVTPDPTDVVAVLACVGAVVVVARQARTADRTVGRTPEHDVGSSPWPRSPR